nr:NAD(P)-binding domain-containing protein [Mesorhizobium silamurunense]
MKIGFIGLGVMGAPMARHLADAGHEIVTGSADADHSSLVRTLEALSDHELSTEKE